MPEEPQTPPETPPAPSLSGPSNEVIDALKREISDLRQEYSKDRKNHDTIIGELKDANTRLEEEIAKANKAFERTKLRPQQTLVPPPPPPTPETGQPLPEGEPPDTGNPRRRGWRGIW